MPGFTMDFTNMRQSVAERVLYRHRQHVQAEEKQTQWERREIRDLVHGAGAAGAERRSSLTQYDPDLDLDLGPNPDPNPGPARPPSRRGSPRRRASLRDRERTAARRQSMVEMPRQPVPTSSRQYNEEVTYTSRVPKNRALLTRRRQSEPVPQEDEGILGEMRWALREADKLSSMRPEKEWQRVLDRTLPGRGGPTRAKVEKGDNSGRDLGGERKARPLGPRKETNLLLANGKGEEEDIGSDWPAHPRPEPTPRPSQMSSHVPSNVPSNAQRMSRDTAVSGMSRPLPTYRSPTRRGRRGDAGSAGQNPGAENSAGARSTSGDGDPLSGGGDSGNQLNILKLDLEGCGHGTPRSNSANSRTAQASDGEGDENNIGDDDKEVKETTDAGGGRLEGREEDSETKDESKEWTKVKKCRYIRGYDPPEMKLPTKDPRDFVFPKDDAM